MRPSRSHCTVVEWMPINTLVTEYSILYDIIEASVAQHVITIIYNDRKKCGKFRPKIRVLDARIDIFEFMMGTYNNFIIIYPYDIRVII